MRKERWACVHAIEWKDGGEQGDVGQEEEMKLLQIKSQQNYGYGHMNTRTRKPCQMLKIIIAFSHNTYM